MRRSQPIKVCMLTNSIYHRDSRIKRYAEYLVQEGDYVDVICLASDNEDAPAAEDGLRVYAIPMTRARREGIWHILQWIASILLMFFYLSKLDLKYRYDLIHVHNMPDLIVFCAVLPRMRGCPIILNVHDPVPEVTRSKLGLPPNHPLVKIQVFLEKISIGFSNHVLTATDAFKRILVERGVPPSKITVVRNAADSRIFRAYEHKPEARASLGIFTLLYVGTVAERYGLDVCVKALPILRKEIPGIRLMIIPKIVNEGQGLDQVLRLARELGVDDLVHVERPVPLEKIPEIMRDADLGLYPARYDCHMDMALSLKIPEMAAVGLCIVATRLSVLEELYGDDAIAFVPPDDHQALARKIIELYKFPETRKRLAASALARSKDLSWESQYKIYREVVEKLLNYSERH